MMKLNITKGSLFLTGINDNVDNFVKDFFTTAELDSMTNRLKRDGTNYHLTVINCEEMKNIDKSTLDAQLQKIDLTKLDLFYVGIGSVSNENSTAKYIVNVSHQLQQLRLSLGLSNGTFHVTLDFTNGDVHARKSLQTIKKYNVPSITNILNDTALEFHKHTTLLEWIIDLHIDELNKLLCDKFSSHMYKLPRKDQLYEKSILLLDSYDYLSGMYFKNKLESKNLSVQDIVHNIMETVKDRTFIVDNDKLIEKSLNILNYPLINNLKWIEEVGHRDKFYRFYSFENNTFTYEELPRNFSFVTDNMAGSSIPDKPKYFDIFKKLGFDCVITLLEEPLLFTQTGHHCDIVLKHFDIDDRTPPTVEQLLEILELIQNSSKTLVHCKGGVGRTATILIACVMMTDKISLNDARGMIAARKTILSASQEEFLKKWYHKCQSGEITLVKKIKPSIKLPSLIILVGLPASGKSTFSSTIDDQIVNIVRVNQDELRAKGKCEELLSQATKQGKTVILDRCNLAKDERKYWLDMNLGKNKVWCIYFNATVEECKWRIKNRLNHPTVKTFAGEKIIDCQKAKLIDPEMSEGFDELHTISSFKESNQFLLKLGCNISHINEENHDGITKFPRTKHLYNLGSATRDDLILDKDKVSEFLNTPIHIEEKIDGANMGISIKDYKIIVQNRSHYVTSAYHAQFKLLDNWVTSHMEDLWAILEDETKILFGEWVYAKHSINYINLPDYFIAFDLYDVNEGRFYSRERLENKLKGTSIHLIPTVKSGSFKTVEDIVKLVRSDSMFYDGPIEGVYVRKCNDKWLETRAKIVRNDFICGDEHWAKGMLTKNTLKI